MINGTKYDLSADESTLDFNELIKTAQIARRLAKEQVHQRLQLWYRLNEQPTSLDAERMEQDAKDLAQVSLTVYVLEEGRNRTYCKLTDKKAPAEEHSSCNKIELIKLLREMLFDRGYGTMGYDGAVVQKVFCKGAGLKDCKEIVEAIVDSIKYY